MEAMKDGDLVQVKLTKGRQFAAIFVHGPRGEGDTFAVEVDGDLVYLNGNCSELLSIRRVAYGNHEATSSS